MKSLLPIAIGLPLLSSCARDLKNSPDATYSYARAAAPYAAMSALAYVDEGTELPAEDKAAEKDINSCGVFLKRNHWKSVTWLHQDEESRAHGLQYRAWINESCRPAILCIAFRGTEFREGQDWRSNFRWIARPFFGSDQYDMIGKKMAPILLTGRYKDRINNGSLVVVTTGHSLGGGLAQNCIYRFSTSVSQCYAFDPSPVTGKRSLSPSAKQIYGNILPINGFPDAQILRIHQKGEILSYVRNTLHLTAGYSNQIDRIRIDVFDGSTAVNLHSMAMLAEGIIEDAPAEPPLSVTHYHRAWWDDSRVSR